MLYRRPHLYALLFVVASLCSADAGQAPAGDADHAPANQHEAETAKDSRHGPFRATSHRRFDDVEHWRKVFDDPERDSWQKPQAIIDALAIEEGMTVVDLGAGTGYFSSHLSTAVGAQGRVFAVETEPNLVAYLRERAETDGHANLTPVLGSFDNPRIPRKSAELILIVDTFHHIDERRGYFERLADSLSPSGRVAVIDWKAGELPKGPPPPHKLPRDQVVREMESSGYSLIVEPEILPYQYFLVFTRR